MARSARSVWTVSKRRRGVRLVGGDRRGVQRRGGELRSLGARLGNPVLGAAVAIGAAGIAWDFLFKANMSPTVSLRLSAFTSDLHRVWGSDLERRGTSSAGSIRRCRRSSSAGWLIYAVYTSAHPSSLARRSGFPSSHSWSGCTVAVGIAVTRGFQPTGFGLQARFLLPGFGVIVVAGALHVATHPIDAAPGAAPVHVGDLRLPQVLRRTHCSDGTSWERVGRSGCRGARASRPLGGWPFLALTSALFAITGRVRDGQSEAVFGVVIV